MLSAGLADHTVEQSQTDIVQFDQPAQDVVISLFNYAILTSYHITNTYYRFGTFRRNQSTPTGYDEIYIWLGGASNKQQHITLTILVMLSVTVVSTFLFTKSSRKRLKWQSVKKKEAFFSILPQKYQDIILKIMIFFSYSILFSICGRRVLHCAALLLQINTYAVCIKNG